MVLVLAIAVPLIVTLWPLPGSGALRLNLVPFATLAAYLASPDDGIGELVNVPVNVLLFVPLAFFAPLASASLRRWWKVALLGLALSFAIEAAQFLFVPGRTADTTDLILNTVGAVIGYATVAALGPWTRAGS